MPYLKTGIRSGKTENNVSNRCGGPQKAGIVLRWNYPRIKNCSWMGRAPRSVPTVCKASTYRFWYKPGSKIFPLH